MKKRILIFCLLIFILFAIAFSVSAEWDTSVSKDEMTGEEIWYASSPSVGPTEKMDFPYGSVKGWLGIGYDGENEWVYAGFTIDPNLSNNTIEDGYNLINTRVKWDEEIENITLTQDWGSKFLHFRNDSIVIEKIAESNTMLLELDWFGEGKVYFRFPLDGSTDAINKMHSAFAK